MAEKRALILAGQIQRFGWAYIGNELEPGLLKEPQVVIEYEFVDRPVKRRAICFALSRWQGVGLPEPEDFIGQLIYGELTFEKFIACWEEGGTAPQRPVLACDFDGVIAEYHGWKGSKEFGEPLPGVVEALSTLREKGWWICIWTTREPVGVWHYCMTRGIPVDSINCIMFRNWAKRKIVADVYLDDRGLKFEGDWTKVVSQILDFKAHWETEGVEEDFTPVREDEVVT